LLNSTNLAVRLRAARELGGHPTDYGPIMDFSAVKKIIRKQQSDGSWWYPGKRAGPDTDYEYLETYRNLGELVEMYALDTSCPTISRAAEFLFSLQTEEGDFRGIYGKEYSPNYTAGVLELLIHAGLGGDERVENGLRWLLSIRQEDGGWAVPLRTVGWKFQQPFPGGLEPVPPDRTKPSSHVVTGVVLRALAASEKYRATAEAKAAASLLASRFFLPDRYPDRKGVEYWTKFSFPFWFTDLVSSLDTVSMMGLPAGHPQVARAIEWFRSRQREDGTWRLCYLKNVRKDVDLWVHFALCRVLKRYSV
jgi:hypothetical protein